ncbi:MAG: imelysin family protein [Pseudomonadales bacterium]
MNLAQEQANRLPPLLDNLSLALVAFLAEPDPESRQTLQQAWLAAHNQFSRTLPLIRIHEVNRSLFSIDAWPIEPGFLDSLPEYQDSGIINDFTLTISRETLIGQHGFTDPSEASLGFHPLEYYAFARPIEDFVPTTLESLEADVIERRRQLVMIVTTELANTVETLVDDLTRTAITTVSPSPAQRLKAIIAGGRRSALSGFQQANLIVDSDQGHCQYSKSSLENLRYETQTLRAIFASDSTLLSILAGIRPETTRNLDSTLDQAVTILNDPQPSEADRAKLPLMLSAISHQLEEFELELTHQRDSR